MILTDLIPRPSLSSLFHSYVPTSCYTILYFLLHGEEIALRRQRASYPFRRSLRYSAHAAPCIHTSTTSTTTTAKPPPTHHKPTTSPPPLSHSRPHPPPPNPNASKPPSQADQGQRSKQLIFAALHSKYQPSASPPSQLQNPPKRALANCLPLIEKWKKSIHTSTPSIHRPGWSETAKEAPPVSNSPCGRRNVDHAQFHALALLGFRGRSASQHDKKINTARTRPRPNTLAIFILLSCLTRQLLLRPLARVVTFRLGGSQQLVA